MGTELLNADPWGESPGDATEPIQEATGGYALRPYQARAIQFVRESKQGALLALPQGTGKTSILLHAALDFRRVLYLSTLRIAASVPSAEIDKWPALRGLPINVVEGNEEQRLEILARKFEGPAVWTMGFHMSHWLIDAIQEKKLRIPRYDLVICDEVTKCKNPATRTFKSTLKLAVAADKVVTASGTPLVQGMHFAWAQMALIDKGERLGKSHSAFLRKHFISSGYGLDPLPGAEAQIKEAIADITFALVAEDWVDIPKIVRTHIEIDLDDEIDEMIKAAGNGDAFKVPTPDGALSFAPTDVWATRAMRAWQLTQGIVRAGEGGKFYEVHDRKIEVLVDLIEDLGPSEAVLVAHHFQADRARAFRALESAGIDRVEVFDGKNAAEIQAQIQRFKDGEIRVLFIHPFCLGADTEVLTENGWRQIVDVRADEKVFDGVEFVHHEGCVWSGRREVVELWGLTMTAGHKLLVDGKWMEAQRVLDQGTSRAAAIFGWSSDEIGGGSLQGVRRFSDDAFAERREGESEADKTVFSVPSVFVPSALGAPEERMERSAAADARLERPELRGSRDLIQRVVGVLRSVLRRYGAFLPTGADAGPDRHGRRLQQRELPVGYAAGAAGEQAQQPQADLRGPDRSPRRTMSADGSDKDRPHTAPGEGNDGGRGCGGCAGPSVQEKDALQGADAAFGRALSPDKRRQDKDASSASQGDDARGSGRARKEDPPREVADVYDLVNAGPRHRFLIRNAAGECFISHNSGGHGIDGLQEGGCRLIWLGQQWSAEGQLQLESRLARSGQKSPSVFVTHIWVRDSIDQAIQFAIERGASGNRALIEALAWREVAAKTELTEEQKQAAYEARLKELRAEMQKTHPDRGGDPDAFIKSRQEFEAFKKGGPL